MLEPFGGTQSKLVYYSPALFMNYKDTHRAEPMTRFLLGTLVAGLRPVTPIG